MVVSTSGASGALEYVLLLVEPVSREAPHESDSATVRHLAMEDETALEPLQKRQLKAVFSRPVQVCS